MGGYLFVYGTLRPALAPPCLQELLRPFRWVAEGAMAGRLYDLGPYPAAVPDDGTSGVVGDVLEIPADAEALAELDRYEGFDPQDLRASLFVRVQRPVRLADGRVLSCWVYAYHQGLERAVPVPGGDYLAWRRRRE